MKKIVCLLFFTILCINGMAQSRCSVCHGNKRVKTHVGVSTYGVSNDRKIQCRYCSQWYWVSTDHWDVCYKCGGTGQGNNRINNNRNDGTEFLSYLDPQDIQAYQNLLQQRMKGTKLVQATCYHCKGSGICQGCHGTGMIFGTQTCPGCYGLRTCDTCGGMKWVSQEVRLSQEELNNLDRMLKIYTDKAINRMNGGR